MEHCLALGLDNVVRIFEVLGSLLSNAGACRDEFSVAHYEN